MPNFINHDKPTAAAWYFLLCSRARANTDREEGNPARFEVRKQGGRINEKFFAFVRKMPGLLQNREFLMHFIWKRDKNDRVSVGVKPIDEEIDYGGSMGKLVRGKTTAIFTATNVQAVEGVNQYYMNIRQKFDLGGHVGQVVAEASSVSHALATWRRTGVLSPHFPRDIFRV